MAAVSIFLSCFFVLLFSLLRITSELKTPARKEKKACEVDKESAPENKEYTRQKRRKSQLWDLAVNIVGVSKERNSAAEPAYLEPRERFERRQDDGQNPTRAEIVRDEVGSDQ